MASGSGQGALIDITVKTLDGQNRTFSVPENLNVRQFKEKISGSIEIPADTQRLIFQGRVMQDDKILKDYNVHGKVIHLVQKAPPTTLSSTTSPTTASAPTAARPQIHLDGNQFDVQIHVGRIQSTPNTSEARARIRQADFNLRLINDVLSQIPSLGPQSEESANNTGQEYPASGHVSGSASTFTADNLSANRMDTSLPPELERTGQSESSEQPHRLQQNTAGTAGSSGGVQEVLMAPELATFLDRVLDINARVVPYIRRYQYILRNEQKYPANSRDSQNAQEVANRVTEVFHALGHMMHSLSDITVNMSSNVPRQAVASPPNPFPLPGPAGLTIPTHMNVRTRPDGNRNRQRSHPPATSAASTTESSTTATQNSTISTESSTLTTAASNTGTSATSTFQLPPHVPPQSMTLPQSTASSGDSVVMVEVFPTSVTVHDISAVVTQAGMDVNLDSGSDSAESLGGPNVTVRSSVTNEHSLGLPTAATPSSTSTAASIPASTAPPPPPSTPQSTGTGAFTTTASSSSTFTFSPMSGMTIGGVPNLGSGQMPDIPGLPPGMLQTIFGSLLNSHVATPSSTSTATPTPASTAPPSPSSTPQSTGTGNFTSTSSSSTFTFSPVTGMTIGGVPDFAAQMSNIPGLPPNMLQNIFGAILNSHGIRSGQPVQVNVAQQVTTTGGAPSRPQQEQPIQDIPLDDERSVPQNLQERSGVQGPVRVDASLQTTSNIDAGTRISVNVATNTPSTGITSTASTSTNTSTSSTTGTTSNASNIFTSTFNLPSMVSQSSLGTRTDPNIGTNSRSTNTPRPYLFHLGSTGQSRQPRMQTRYQQPGSLQPIPGSQAYMDPFLPCFSPQYMSQSALAALSALQRQTGGQSLQQIPNLSTMVSEMVREIIGQVGQARTSASTILTSTTPNSSSSMPAAETTTVNSGSNQHPATPNPVELLSQLFMNGGPSQTGPVPPEFGTMLSSIMQALIAPASTTAEGNTTAPILSLADLFSHVRDTNENGVGETSVIIALLEAVAPHISLTDMFAIVMGNARVLTRVRGHLQEFVRSLIDRHGSVEQVVEVALNEMSSDIQHLQSLVQVREGTDMAGSIHNCLRAHLLRIFDTINSGSSGSHEDFGSHLYTLWVRMFAEVIGLCVYCIRDGHAGFFNMLQNYMPRMTQGMSPLFTNWTTQALQSILVSFHRNHPVADSEIIGYVVNKPDITTETSSHEQNQSESQTSSADVVPNLNHTTAPAINHTSVSETSPSTHMDTTQSPISQAANAEIITAKQEENDETQELFEDAQETFTNHRPPVAHPNTLATQVLHTDGSVNGSKNVTNGRSSNDWQSVVPQEWIPIISQDIVRQQEQRPQPPFSDAYLQGLPAKRRRMMSLEHSHELGNMPQYLPDSLKRAARAAGVEPSSCEENIAQEAADNHDLHAELEREITAVLQSRITSDQDFSCERFPNAEKLFVTSKHH